jgi:hypothetical protein
MSLNASAPISYKIFFRHLALQRSNSKGCKKISALALQSFALERRGIKKVLLKLRSASALK